MIEIKRTENFRGISDTVLLEKEGVISDYQFLDSDSTDIKEERTSKNLEKIMHYEQYDMVKEKAELDAKFSQLIKEAQVITAPEIDTTPSSTTMQFADDKDAESFYNENSAKESFQFKMQGKTKLLVALYSVVVVALLTLIVMNTGVINVISGKISARQREIEGLKEEYGQIVNEIDEVSSDEYVINKAENEYNMVK